MKAERYFATVLLLGFLLAASFAHAQQNVPVSLSGNWEYLAIDLPDDGHSIFPNADAAWSPLDHPKHKNPKCTTDVWFRNTLPNWEGDDPAVFIRLAKEIIEVYLDSTKIYRYGDFTSRKQIEYSGLRWHLFNLPENFAGKTITLHIRASHAYPGIMGEIVLGSRNTIVGKIVKDNIVVVVIGLLLVLSGIISALIFSLIKNIRIYAGFVVLQIAVGVQTIVVSPILQLIISAPRAVHYIDNISLFTALIGFIFLAANIVEARYRIIFKRIAQILMVLAVATMAVDITLHPFQRYIFIPLYALIFMLVLLFIFISLKSYRSVAHHKRLFLLGLNVYALFASIEIVVYYLGIFNASGVICSWFLHFGALCLFFFLSWIIVSRFVEINKQTIVSLQRDRERIARDLHDEIGPRLTEIKIVSELVRRENLPAETIDEKLDDLSFATDNVLSSFREIIWALNPANSGLEELATYLGQCASDFLGKAAVRCRLELLPEFPAVEVPYGFRRNLIMAVKEALNNVVKHAGASLVKVSITTKDRSFIVEIEDNGQGFDTGKVHRYGNGLKNIHYRIENFGGKVTIESVINCGTTITMHIPMDVLKQV